ncbi:MAG: nitroreductase family protein [Acidimicrobiia bacterium]
MDYPTIPYRPLRRTPSEMRERASAFHRLMEGRRSVRDFSGDAVPRQLIDLAIATASSAPSGAHRQPWTFVVVGDSEIKAKIREAAEAEEKENYEGGRLPDDWLEALAPLGTDWRKPFLETAPWLVVVFEQRFGIGTDGDKQHNYYVKESVGMACGLFIAALHNMGLATLTHTPSPMRFLSKLLERPENERPFVLFPIGYPSPDCVVPDIHRKDLHQVVVDS